MTEQIAIVGSGNVASHMARALSLAGINIVGIYSRNIKHAQELASEINTKAIENIEEITQAGIILFSISDRALKEVLLSANWQNKLLLHTAGSIEMDIFKGFSENYGVFYPLQTFSKARKLNYNQIPFLLEANNEQNYRRIENIAQKISKNVYSVDSVKRKQLHLSAVYVCNFTNHMWAIGQEICRENQLDFKILHPLMKETLNKALDIGPEKAQTGPAVRNDKNIMNKHLSLIKNRPLWEKIYSFVSKSIYNTQKKMNGKF